MEYCDKRRRGIRISFCELEEVDGGKLDLISELVKRALPMSLPKRMMSICDALGVRKQIDRFIERASGGRLLDDFDYFCRLRNMIAHSEPAPSLDEYGIEIETLEWDDLRSQLERTTDQLELPVSTALTRIIDAPAEWGRRSSLFEYLLILDTLFEMAVLYAASFDFFVFRQLASEDSRTNDGH